MIAKLDEEKLEELIDHYVGKYGWKLLSYGENCINTTPEYDLTEIELTKGHSSVIGIDLDDVTPIITFLSGTTTVTPDELLSFREFMMYLKEPSARKELYSYEFRLCY